MLVVILIIVGVVVLALGILKLSLVGARLIEKRVDRTVSARLAAIYAPEQMILSETMANFFGDQSKGARQVRGNGGLVLTKDSLVFHMLVPERTITIPLESVREVSIVGSHLGKSVRRDLLHVDYAVEDGTDAIAWFVRDPQAWRQELEARAGRGW